MSNERAPWEIEDEEVLSPWEVDDTQEESAPWEVVDDENLLPQPFYETQPNAPLQPSQAFTNPSLDLSGQGVEKQDGVSHYVEGYNPDGSINPKSERWKGLTPNQIIEARNQDVRDGVIDKHLMREGPAYDQNAQIADVSRDKDLKERQEKLQEKKPELTKDEIYDKATKDQLIDGGKTAAQSALVAVPAGQGFWGMLGMGALAGGADSAIEVAADAAKGDKELLSVDSGLEVLKGAGLGGAVGGGLHGLAKVGEAVLGSKQAKALDKLNKIGKKSNEKTHFSEEMFIEASEEAVSKGAKVKDVDSARDLGESFAKLHDEGGKVGTTSLSRAIENPEIQQLIAESGSRWEKASKVVTGSNNNTFRNKTAENLGLRSGNLAADRKDAVKQLEHSVRNTFEDISEQFAKEAKEGLIAKSDMAALKSVRANTNKAIAASRSGNKARFDKYISKASKELKVLEDVDNVAYQAIKGEIAKVKSSNSLRTTATKKDEGEILSNVMSIGGMAMPMLNGYQDGDLTTAGMTAAALYGGKRGINKLVTRSAGKQLDKVNKALKGNLGELKARHKAMDEMKNMSPLLRAYLMSKDEEK